MSHTVKPLPDGKFDIQDSSGQSVSEKFGGAFTQREAAEAACRMLNAFDAADSRISAINDSLRKQAQLETTPLERNRKLLQCMKALRLVQEDLGFMSLDEDVRKAVDAALIPIGGWEAGLARIHKALFEEG